jgi:hypothetical protein
VHDHARSGPVGLSVRDSKGQAVAQHGSCGWCEKARIRNVNRARFRPGWFRSNVILIIFPVASTRNRFGGSINSLQTQGRLAGR